MWSKRVLEDEVPVLQPSVFGKFAAVPRLGVLDHARAGDLPARRRLPTDSHKTGRAFVCVVDLDRTALKARHALWESTTPVRRESAEHGRRVRYGQIVCHVRWRRPGGEPLFRARRAGCRVRGTSRREGRRRRCAVERSWGEARRSRGRHQYWRVRRHRWEFACGWGRLQRTHRAQPEQDLFSEQRSFRRRSEIEALGCSTAPTAKKRARRPIAGRRLSGRRVGRHLLRPRWYRAAGWSLLDRGEERRSRAADRVVRSRSRSRWWHVRRGREPTRDRRRRVCRQSAGPRPWLGEVGHLVERVRFRGRGRSPKACVGTYGGDCLFE